MVTLPISSAQNAFNAAIADFVSQFKSPALTELMILLTDLGSPQNLAMLALVLVCVYWLHKKYVHMAQFIIAFAAVNVITTLLKYFFAMPRPADPAILVSGFSFPSGHTSAATLFFLLIAYTFKNHFRPGWKRLSFIGANVLAIFMIGVSRVYLSVHYANDILAGILVGLIVALLSVLVTELKYKEII